MPNCSPAWTPSCPFFFTTLKMYSVTTKTLINFLDSCTDPAPKVQELVSHRANR